jgi:hypothetical protein
MRRTLPMGHNTLRKKDATPTNEKLRETLVEPVDWIDSRKSAAIGTKALCQCGAE